MPIHWFGVCLGIVLILFGLLAIIRRSRVASWNARTIRRVKAEPGEQAARNSTPINILIVGLGATVMGIFLIWSSIESLQRVGG